MPQGINILRRLLIAAGAVVAAIAFLYAATLALTDGNTSTDVIVGVLSMIFVPLLFWGYRALVNWVLLYETSLRGDSER